MKILNTLSGGKDSQAATLWLLNNGYKNFITVFCDTGWENEITYQHIKYIDEKLGLNVITLRSKKYKGLIDLARKKSRFPSTKRRFCTSELKVQPMIDYILDIVKDDFIVIQGIRGAESESRSNMASQCNYFKYYFEPISTNTTRLEALSKQLNNSKSKANKNKIIKKIEKINARLSIGKEDPKFHTYRKKEVIAYCKLYATDVLRPVFDKSAQWVINYILDNGMIPNPLYKMGRTRVGCDPCISCNLMEIHQINIRQPERIIEIAGYENEIGSTFFSYNKVPDKFCKKPSIIDVAKYATSKYEAGELFDDDESTSCMSYYGLCE